MNSECKTSVWLENRVTVSATDGNKYNYTCIITTYNQVLSAIQTEYSFHGNHNNK